MTSAAYALRRALEALLQPLDRLPPGLALALVALLGGALLTLGYGRLTPQRTLRRVRDRMAAAAYEARLFLDSPLLLLRALGRLLVFSLASVVLMLPALLVLALPAGLVALHLELRHGKAPLAVGVPVLLRVELAPGVDGRALRPVFDGQAVAVTAPPLLVTHERAVYLRVEVKRPERTRVGLALGAAVVDKELQADPAARRVSEERAAGGRALVAAGLEAPLPAGGIVGLRLRHPERDRRLFGLPWWLGALLLSCGAALVCGRRAGITF
jgi:hypothetical protein